MTEAFIFDALRTPRAKASAKGAFNHLRPVDLVSALLGALKERTALDTAQVEDVVLGCSSATGAQGANIAKISALYAGWSEAAPGMTVSRFCTSGLDAIHIASLKAQAGARLVVAGGVEMLSKVSMFADGGPWFSDEDVKNRTGYIHMGLAADLVASSYKIDRAQTDAYAARSHARAQAAIEAGRFKSVLSLGGLDRDECIRPKNTTDRLAKLEPLFGASPEDEKLLKRYPSLDRIDHVHTLGSGPALADGASVLLIGDGTAADLLQQKPRARVRAFATASVDPVMMLTGNTSAIKKALTKAGLTASDIELFEVNESFAAVPLQVSQDLDLDPERLNVNGGAIAMGHPLGATGGVLVSTLLDELERRDLTLGLASICGGAGVAAAIVLQRL